MKTIAFANNKGGVLKTSLTTNYAAVLSKKGKKILIIDSDNQNSVLSSFGKQNTAEKIGLYNLVFENANISDAITNVYENIDVIPSGKKWNTHDSEMVQRIINQDPFKRLSEIINEIKKLHQYDYILFDTEPAKSSNTFSVLLASDEVIIPFTLEFYGIRGMVEMNDYIEKAKKGNPKLKIKAMVGTKTNARSKVEKMIREQAKKLPEPGLCLISIPNSISGINSISLKKLPVYLTSKNKLSQAYENLVNLLEFNIKDK
ncbi:ParA/Soj family protein [Mesomycoplasma conjunctivae]|nr:ParA/Soj family protein [Mesomycoplasma conjunctivae]